MATEVEQEPEEERDAEADAEALARRRIALAQIRQYPDSVLRMEARQIADVDDEVRRLAARMVDLMHDANGVGLAATQVGILRRMFVVQLDEDDVRAVVNPRIVERGDELATDDEGCLSLQGVLVPVERNVRVVLEGLDDHGGELRLELEEMAARVVQHELDHLDGTLILDRTDADSRREALGTLRPRPALRA